MSKQHVSNVINCIIPVIDVKDPQNGMSKI